MDSVLGALSLILSSSGEVGFTLPVWLRCHLTLNSKKLVVVVF